MKLYSWNVNGFRAVVEKGVFGEFVVKHDPDILCLQETKLNASIIPNPEVPNFQNPQFPNLYPYQYWHLADKPGYSGTAVLSKTEPLNVKYDEGGEGRVITAEFEKFIIVTAYVPNSKDDLSRLPFRMKWDAEFRQYLYDRLSACRQAESLSYKPVYVCGDLNCAHNEIDLAHPASNRMSAGFTDEERAGFGALLEAGFVDTFRAANPDAAGCYTWWSYRSKARERNIGWRIDYWLASRGAPFTEPLIHGDVLGSDHCPVSVEV